MTQQKVLFMASMAEFGFELQTHIQEGWEINPQWPMQPLGFGLEVGLLRDPTAEQLSRDAQPKVSRAEILKKARDAKAEKAAAKESAE